MISSCQVQTIFKGIKLDMELYSFYSQTMHIYGSPIYNRRNGSSTLQVEHMILAILPAFTKTSKPA